ncbi:hypothetical protein V6N11_034372 [Hibiscus sabdariffa]|uniref:Uncharacterized protein n=2 Tax=Hibiscus sabdariffa TaxID=183260 RepID=A0ABR2NAW4_9ROSI
MLQLEDDSWSDSPNVLKSHAVRFFQDFFTSQGRGSSGTSLLGNFHHFSPGELRTLQAPVTMVRVVPCPTESFGPDSVSWRWEGTRTFSTNVERCHRHLASLLVCGLCGQCDDDVLHSLRGCKKAREVWFAAVPQSSIEEFMTAPLEVWFETNICTDFPLGNISGAWNVRFATICWQLWK